MEAEKVKFQKWNIGASGPRRENDVGVEGSHMIIKKCVILNSELHNTHMILLPG